MTDNLREQIEGSTEMREQQLDQKEPLPIEKLPEEWDRLDRYYMQLGEAAQGAGYDKGSFTGKAIGISICAAQLRASLALLAAHALEGEGPGLRGRIAARIDEYAFVAQMISGVEKEGWYIRRLSHLKEMYENAGPQVPASAERKAACEELAKDAAESHVRKREAAATAEASHIAVISPPEAQAILANPHATKEEIERAHAMTYEIPCEHPPAEAEKRVCNGPLGDEEACPVHGAEIRAARGRTVIPGPTEAERLAKRFHEIYEDLAPSFGYETRKDSAKPWAEVPERNKLLMIAVCRQIITENAAELPPATAERKATNLPAEIYDYLVERGYPDAAIIRDKIAEVAARIEKKAEPPAQPEESRK